MNIKKESFINKQGLFIDVYENLFTVEEQLRFLKFFNLSLFAINGSDSDLTNELHNFIFSSYNDEDVKNLGFYNTNGFKFLQDTYKLDKRKIKQIRIKCCSPLELNLYHTDGKGVTLIYYANVNWNMFWGGHTVFLDNDISEIEKIVNYKSGKVIVFDGSIPHSTTPVSIMARSWRMSFVIQYTDVIDEC